MSQNQIPDDRSYYTAEDEGCIGDDWKECPCDECQSRREDYADMQYQRRRDEEFEK